MGEPWLIKSEKISLLRDQHESLFKLISNI